MKYEHKAAVNWPTASIILLKLRFFFDCESLQADHKAAKLIFHGYTMFQGKEPQRETPLLITDVLLMAIEVRRLGAAR